MKRERSKTKIVGEGRKEISESFKTWKFKESINWWNAC